MFIYKCIVYYTYKIMEVCPAMKRCKYCNQPGRFDRSTRKVLCSDHASLENNIRHIWMAIADLQFKSEIRIQE